MCLFALLSLVQGAKADGYITDIMTISGGSSSIKNQYIEQGWTVAGGDLNSGAGGDYEGYDVTDAWNGSDVTDTGANMPNWNNDAVRNTCTRVVFDESFAEARPKSLCQWFSLMVKLEEIDGIQNLNTSEVTNMGLTFLSCILLESLDLSGFNVSQVSNTTAMFNGCSSLNTIYSDNIWNVATSEQMFYGCKKLVGAASYSSSKNGGEMANPVTGYFTSRTTLADNMDNAPVLAERNHYYGHVTLSGRTLYKDGCWNTLCLPFSLTEGQVSTQLAPEALMELDTDGTYDGHKTGFTVSTNTLYLYFKNATSIEAGKPYLVKWANTGENISNPVFYNVTLSSTTPTLVTSTDKGDDLGNVSFTGTYSPKDIFTTEKTTLYLDANNHLCYPWGEDMTSFTINSFRAYFQLNNGFVCGEPGSTGTINNFVLNFGEETNGIEEISNLKPQTSNPASWFTLDGRKLSGKPTQKGIYVNNGRKVVMK